MRNTQFDSGQEPFNFKGMRCAILVISRKNQERLVIGADIVITVVQIDRNRVRLGIEAPKEVAIVREELLAPHLRPKKNGKK